jgi:transposase InsO family protein
VAATYRSAFRQNSRQRSSRLAFANSSASAPESPSRWVQKATASTTSRRVVLATLKKELVRRRSWPNRRELQSTVFDYIESFYNRERRHSTSTISPERVRDDLNSSTKRN